MKKLLILVIVVIIVLLVLFVGGDDAGEATLPDGAPGTGSSSDEDSDSLSDGPDGANGSNIEPASNGANLDDEDARDEKENTDDEDDASSNDSQGNEQGVLRNAQTYTNNADGYEVKIHEWWWWRKYIRNSSQEYENEKSIVKFDRNELLELDLDEEGHDWVFAPIEISTLTTSYSQNMDQFKKTFFPNATSKKITIDGKEAIRLSRVVAIGGSDVESEQEMVFIKGDKYTYTLLVTYDGATARGNDVLAIFNAMVESFRLI